jgi:hypothetical protein
MADPDRLVVAGFILLLLGLSYIAAVAAFATAYLVPATVVYLLVATVLLLRILTRSENTS